MSEQEVLGKHEERFTQNDIYWLKMEQEHYKNDPMVAKKLGLSEWTRF